MKTILYTAILLSMVCLFSPDGFAQKNKPKPLDSTLEANSEKWKVKKHKGLFGLSKPEFGPYKTLVAEKLDSPVIRRKRKSSGTGISVSGGDWDISKQKTFEKKKFYRLTLAGEKDSIDIQFLVHTVSEEKQQTFLGKMLSKTDEGKNATLAYQKNISGITYIGNEPEPVDFFIEDYVTTRQVSRGDPQQKDPLTWGYILINSDSLFTEPIIHTTGIRALNFSFEWQTGIFMDNANGEHIAALSFSKGMPFTMWIRRDLDRAYQQAIAAFFAVIIGAEDL